MAQITGAHIVIIGLALAVFICVIFFAHFFITRIRNRTRKRSETHFRQKLAKTDEKPKDYCNIESRAALSNDYESFDFSSKDLPTSKQEYHEHDIRVVEHLIGAENGKQIELSRYSDKMLDFKILFSYLLLLPDFADRNGRKIQVFCGLMKLLNYKDEKGGYDNEDIFDLANRLRVTKPNLLLLPFIFEYGFSCSLIVINFMNSEIEIYDFLNDDFDTLSLSLSEIFKRINEYRKIKFKIVKKPVPIPSGTGELGLIMCLNAKIRCTTNNFDYTDEQLIKFRQEVLISVINKKIE